MVKTDSFGNIITGELPYARGKILKNTEDDYKKVIKANKIILDRRKKSEVIYDFTGLDRGFPFEASDYQGMTDEISGAIYGDELRIVGLNHLGGNDREHDILLTNRMTAATIAVHLALVKPNQIVVGISPSYSHPSIIRAARLAGARFIDFNNIKEFESALDSKKRISLLCITRLAVTYDIMETDNLKHIIETAKSRGINVFIDDAGGARVGPSIFKQPKSLELGADLVATGLDKYGVVGPRFGLLGGRKDLVSIVRAKTWELGLEARPVFFPSAIRSLKMFKQERVESLVNTTKEVGKELKVLLGPKYVHDTPVTSQILAEDLLKLCMERADIDKATIVPYEATAALSMLLLKNYGILTVHFAGIPPGTASTLLKFVHPETLEKFGGAKKLAEAINSSINELSKLLRAPTEIYNLLLV